MTKAIVDSRDLQVSHPRDHQKERQAISGNALIVEDHPLYGDALNQVVNIILGKFALLAKSAEEGLALARTAVDLQLILLDPGLPQLCGAEAISAFRRACPQAVLIAIVLDIGNVPAVG